MAVCAQVLWNVEFLKHVELGSKEKRPRLFIFSPKYLAERDANHASDVSDGLDITKEDGPLTQQSFVWVWLSREPEHDRKSKGVLKKNAFVALQQRERERETD